MYRGLDDRLHHLFRGLQRRRQQVRLERPGLGPETPVVEILREYGRYFIGDRYADGFAQGLLALERNWRGPLLTNAGVETTLQQFQDDGAVAPARATCCNWRFQQALYRAYYDAYVRDRLIDETAQQAEAMEALREAPSDRARSPRWSGPRRSSTRARPSRSRPTAGPGSSSWPRRCSRASGCS